MVYVVYAVEETGDEETGAEENDVEGICVDGIGVKGLGVEGSEVEGSGVDEAAVEGGAVYGLSDTESVTISPADEETTTTVPSKDASVVIACAGKSGFV